MRIVGTANLSQAKAEVAKLKAQVDALNASIAASHKAGPFSVNPHGYQRMNQQLALNSALYRNAAASTGMFEVQQLRVNSATEEYTRLLEKQKISFRDWARQAKVSRAAYKEQLALSQMEVRQLPGRTADGRRMLDITFPTEVHKDLDTMGNKIGWIREQTRSAATQMVNWGKNTQWAGRQLMVGFTMPVAAFGAAAGVMAYQVDKQMTRIQKVYDTTADATSNSLTNIATVERELMHVREASMRTAMTAARQYGTAASDTLEIQAELAATGLKGTELQRATAETMRIATLGEIEHQTALESTIALQSVFRMSNDELTQSFNYMNAVENATSLQLKDFAAAIPIAAGPVASFGGDIQELGVLLTAMRERGIGATQGANALKAALQRLGRPSKIVQEEFAAITGGDIVKINEESKSLTEIFQRIGELTKDLDKADRRKVFAGLFGTYQVTRMGALVEGMEDLRAGVGQVSDAFELGQKKPGEWAKAADRELSRFQESASGRLKTTFESLKLELAKMGEPFLEIAVIVVKAVQKVLEAFNSLGETPKRLIAGFAIFTAILGPLIMLTGLAGNFIGNFLKMGVAVTGLFTNFKLLNKESAAARLAAKLAADGFTTEASAVAKLTAELKALSLAQLQAARAAGQMPGVFQSPFRPGVVDSGFIGPLLPGQSRSAQHTGPTRKRNPNGTFAPGTPTNPRGMQYQYATPANPVLNSYFPTPITAPQSAIFDRNNPNAAREAQEQAKASERTERAMRGAATSAGIFAAAMVASTASSNETVDKMAQWAMVAAIAGPGLWGMAKALKSVKWGSMVSHVSKLGPAIVRMAKALREASLIMALVLVRGIKFRDVIAGSGAALMRLLSPMGVMTLALAAAAASAYLVYKHSRKAADAIDSYANNAEPLADILGYTYSETGDPEAVDNAQAHISKLKQINEEYGTLVGKIQEADSAQEKFNLAADLGLQVINTGGTVEQAREATRLALEAAEGQAAAKQITIQFKQDFQFDDADVIRQAQYQTERYMNEAMKPIEDRPWYEDWDINLNPLADPTDLTPETESNLKAMGERAEQLLATGMSSGRGAEPWLNNVYDSLAKIDEKIANSTGLQKSRWEGLRKEYVKTIVSATAGKDAADALSDGFLDTAGAIAVAKEAMVSLTDKERFNLLRRMERELKAQGEALPLPLFIRLQRLYQKLYGNKETENGIKGQADAMGGLTRETRRAAAEVANLEAKMKAFKDVDWVDTYKGAMESTQNQIADAVSENFDARRSDALDAYGEQQRGRLEDQANRQEAASERFAKRWENRYEAVNKMYDARIDRVNKLIDAEQRAEEKRQKIFDAEIQRLQRLAEMANTNIDFNVALNTGQLDEAAKIRNDMEAKEADWALSDAGEAGAERSQKRQDALGARADNLAAARDARLEHMKEIEERQKEALERQQERARKALEDEVENNIEAQEKIWDNRKKNLDKAIELFKNYVPKNEKDLRAHIKRVAEQYGVFNANTKTKFNSTSENIGKMLKENVRIAAEKIRDEIAWEGVGEKVANRMIRGALGMDFNQFRDWMISGEWPEGAGKRPTVEDLTPKGHANAKAAKENALKYHTGGIVGVDRGGWAGKKGSRDEVSATLLKGEGVLSREAMSRIGPAQFKALNEGGTDYGTGGAGMGIAGILGGMMRAAMVSTINNAIVRGSINQLNRAAMDSQSSFSAGKAGQYADVDFNMSQLKHAATIASVGKSMGMSARDIQIGIMTAITESMLSLPNQAQSDRDSAGLFQQRPSQGWGTVAQVMDPVYAATQFFKHLKNIEGRADMAPWLAAQAVQRSAYSDGSNYQQYWNEAQAIFNSLQANDSAGVDYAPGKGGWRKPAPSGYGWGNTHDYQVPIGTPLYAVSDGTIVESRAITSGGSPGNGLYPTPYRSYGETVVLRTASGDLFRYAHMNPGTRIGLGPVSGGTMIGKSGNTGNSSGPHVHFDINGYNQNAIGWLRDHGIGLKTGGFTMSDGLANLHKNEVVIDPQRTKMIMDGIDSTFANGRNATYNLNMHVNGNVDVDALVNKTVVAIQRLEARRPMSRSVK